MMDPKEIFKKVGGIIVELTEQYQYLSRSADKMNDLELELFLANSNFLSDHIEVLRKLNKSVSLNSPSSGQGTVEAGPGKMPSAPETNKKDTSENTHEENIGLKKDLELKREDIEIFKLEKDKEVESEPERKVDNSDKAFSGDHSQTNIDNDRTSDEPIKSDLSQSENRAHDSFISDKKQMLSDEDPLEKEHNVQEEKDNKPEEDEGQNVAGHKIEDEREERKEENKDTEPEVNIHYKEPQNPIVEEPVSNRVVQTEKTIAIAVEETPAGRVPTINDLHSASPKNDFSAKLSHIPVTDLKTSISLNDKLLFVKDLFNGYSLAYSEAIELLNRFDNLESADNFLKTNYSVKNKWSERQATADKFYEILEKRFRK